MSGGIDVLDRAVAALRAAGVAEAQARPLSRLDGKDGVVVRMMPPITRRTYFDGSRMVDCPLQVIAKSLDELAAMETCEKAARILCSADLSSANGSYRSIDGAEPDGGAERLSVGSDGRFVWAARVVVKMIRE